MSTEKTHEQTKNRENTEKGSIPSSSDKFDTNPSYSLFFCMRCSALAVPLAASLPSPEQHGEPAKDHSMLFAAFTVHIQ